MLTSIQELRGLVKNIIELLDEMIEDSGQHGDFVSAETYIKDSEIFKGMLQELGQLHNSDIHASSIKRALTEYVPSLDLSLMAEYTEIFRARIKLEIEDKKRQLFRCESLLNSFKDQM